MAKKVSSRKGYSVGYIVLTFHVFSENGNFVSACPELDVASCGDTVDEALKNIKDATLLYLNTLEEQGERERIFKERKIRLHRVAPKSAKVKREVKSNEVISPYITSIPVAA